MTQTTTTTHTGLAVSEILGVIAAANKPQTFLRALCNTYDLAGSNSLTQSINKKVKPAIMGAGTEGTAITPAADSMRTKIQITAGRVSDAYQPTFENLQIRHAVSDLESLINGDMRSLAMRLEPTVAKLMTGYEMAVENKVMSALSSLTTSVGLVGSQVTFLTLLDAIYAYKQKENDPSNPVAFLLPSVFVSMLQRAQIASTAQFWQGKSLLGAGVAAGQAGSFLDIPVFENASAFDKVVTVSTVDGYLGCLFSVGSPNAGTETASPDAPFGAFAIVESGPPQIGVGVDVLTGVVDVTARGWLNAGLTAQDYGVAIYGAQAVA